MGRHDNIWRLRRDGRVAVLALARPPVNALDHAGLESLGDRLREIAADPAIGALVLASELEGVFCTGGDLKYWGPVASGDEVARVGRGVFAALEGLAIPTLAAIAGSTIGDGLSLALACDFRITSADAAFRLPEAGYGFIPGWGTIRRLADAVGPVRAKELLLTGRRVEAGEAAALGLASAVVAADRVIPEAIARGRALAELSATAVAALKRAFNGGDEMACFIDAWHGADRREGIAALFAKRPPVFAPRRISASAQRPALPGQEGESGHERQSA